MGMIGFLEGRAGRWTRAGAGALLIGVGAWLSGPLWALAAVGLVPLGAAIGNVCLVGPLVHRPLRPASRPGGPA